MKSSSRCSGSKGFALALSLSLAASISAATPAAAVEVGFDDLASLSDVAGATLPGVAVSTALVLSEADVQTLLGFPAVGSWATSPSNGLLNTFAPTIRFTFSVPVTAFSIDILSIENDGLTLAVALRGAPTDLDQAPTTVVSETGLIGNSGLHEQRLSIVAPLGSSFFDVEVMALDLCMTPACGSIETSTFWLDSASFTPVPEAGTLTLLGAGLAVLAGALRANGRRS